MTAMDLDIARDMLTLSAKARSTYAADVFDPYVVALRIRTAARQGAQSVQITQEKPVDLSETPAAADLIAFLTRLHYETDWVEVRRIEPGPRGQPAREYHYRELLVSWHRRALAKQAYP
jgi:hypothetical protein